MARFSLLGSTDLYHVVLDRLASTERGRSSTSRSKRASLSFAHVESVVASSQSAENVNLLCAHLELGENVADWNISKRTLQRPKRLPAPVSLFSFSFTRFFF